MSNARTLGRGLNRIKLGTRAAVLAATLTASVGGGLALSQPASAAPNADHFLSTVIPCESGGNPHAVNSIGAGGLFQFLPSTWHGLGGRGLPQHASVGEQWQMARKLYAQAGTSPWYASKPCWGHRI
ncbi:transglycosylase family protein [Candidatus Frankia nodulisporulans]|uniref:transglycosylase family protein n=1 Tax=Candidatus Frankia nodulisporulans TaxID=2060052 RepID=UPI0013D09AA1|nr:transglycosylase family protein [Candidatus Frankia nodulisporulans]